LRSTTNTVGQYRVRHAAQVAAELSTATANVSPFS
jgi:hypothetical protein